MDDDGAEGNGAEDGRRQTGAGHRLAILPHPPVAGQDQQETQPERAAADARTGGEDEGTDHQRRAEPDQPAAGALLECQPAAARLGLALAGGQQVVGQGELGLLLSDEPRLDGRAAERGTAFDAEGVGRRVRQPALGAGLDHPLTGPW